MTDRELLLEAIRATEKAYAPYSRFRVGAALLARSGTVYTGANIENASYGATVCAERTALWQAVLCGEKEFDTLAVAAVQADGTPIAAPPCGICRQTLSEFSDGSLRIIIGTPDELQTFTLRDLLPEAFAL